MENSEAEPAILVEIPEKVVEDEAPVGARYPAATLTSEPEMSPKGVFDEPLAALPTNATAFPGFADRSTLSILTVYVQRVVTPAASVGVGNGEPAASEMPVIFKV